MIEFRTVRRSRTAVLAIFALVLAACGSGGDDTVRDENGNVVEGGEISVFSLNVGDCFNDLPVGTVTTADAVPCAEEHLYEVYHLFDVSLDEFDAAAIDTAASDGCVGAFEGYMAVPFETSYYTFDGLQPSEGSWGAGDREVVCLATPKNGSTTAGTARNAGLVDEQALAAPEPTTTTTTTAPIEETTTTAAAPPVEESTATTAGGGSQSVFELNVGECYVGLPGSGEVNSVEPISCNEPHGIEIMALFDIDLPAFDIDAVGEQARDGCLEAFEPYMGVTYELSWYELDWLQPTAGSWNSGDREVVCVVYPYDEDITQSVGSAQGTGRQLGN